MIAADGVADVAVIVEVAVVIAAREVETIARVPEIARLAKKFVRPNQRRVPAVPPVRVAQPAAIVHHDRVVANVHRTIEVRDVTIGHAAETAMTGPATIVLGKNRVVRHHHLRVLLLRRSQRRILETLVPASLKSSRNHHQRRRLIQLTHRLHPRVAADVTNRLLKVPKQRMPFCEIHIVRAAGRLMKTSSGPMKIPTSSRPHLAVWSRPLDCLRPMRRASPIKQWPSPMSKRLKETTRPFVGLVAADVDVVLDRKLPRLRMATKEPRSI